MSTLMKRRGRTRPPCFKEIFSAMFMLHLAGLMLFGQGVRMSADFLPLEVGNRWVYAVSNENGQRIGELDVRVQDRTILSGRSYYVFNQFPFAPGFDGNRSTLVRYDRSGSQYMRREAGEDAVLFAAESASTEVVETDESGLPSKFRMNTGNMTLTFERGAGVVQAKIQSDRGPQTMQLVGALVGQRKIGEVPPQSVAREQKTKELVENVTTITEKNPLVEVQSQPSPEGHKFILTVKNTSDKLLAFDFNSGQSFDFVVTDPAAGREIWRWSRRMFFTAVIRSEAIRPKGQWTFEAVWNHRDNDLNPVQPGQYRVVGILTSRKPVESEPVSLEVK